jgi:hypothetical protein
MTLPTDQGRARGLYDEQAQRVQQEKLLGARGKAFLLSDAEPGAAPTPQELKTGA